MENTKTHKCFGGEVQFWRHQSEVTGTPMNFSAFVPNGTVNGALLWLSGLTCNEENFITKAGAQRCLAEQGLMVLCPDTSPRGLDLPGEHDSYDFGSGAGFYLDATEDPYSEHYKMYSYIVNEFIPLASKSLGFGKNLSIFGHSMGGHGALTIGLKNPEVFKSISAFSPIVNPVNVPWGQKAFKGYLGDDVSRWKDYDACELLRAGLRHSKAIFIDQGLDDNFFTEQLRTELFEKAASEVGQSLKVAYREGYDHSYYYIATFIEEHIKFHAESFKQH